MKITTFTFILICCQHFAFAQEWTKIPYEDISGEGLKIISLYQDSEGNIWGGNSYGGLVIRWDGNNWNVFNSDITGLYYDSPAVSEIFQDSNGKMWFCSLGDGIATLENGTWANYNTMNSTIPSNWVSDVIEKDGQFWFTMGKRIVSYDGGAWTKYDIPDANYSAGELSAMDGGRIFVTMINGDPVRRFDNGNWEIFSTSTSNIGSNYQYVLGKVDGQTCWFGGPNGRANLYEKGGFTPSANMANWQLGLGDYILKIAVNGAKDDIWFATGNGLHHLNGSQWSSFDPGNSPMTGWEVQTVMIANDGKIWLSTENEILIYNPGPSTPATETNPATDFNIVPSLATDHIRLEGGAYSSEGLGTHALISIYDISGALVMKKNEGQTLPLTILIGHFRQGIYLLKYEVGQYQITKKFSKL